MSRFSYSLDVGEELEKEKEVRRRIAAARGEEEERVKLDPKFEEEIKALADEPQPHVEDDDSIVITPAKVGKESIKIESPREAKRSEKQKVVPKARPKTAPKAALKPAMDELKVIQQEPAPAQPPMHTEPRTPGDGSGRLVVALLLIALVGIFLIYTGLASNEERQSCAMIFAGGSNLTAVTLDKLSGARQHWFSRALLADNEGEAAALMRMALCPSGNVTESSNVLEFQSCDVGGQVVEVSERELRGLVNLSARTPCDALESVISCDNGYFIDGTVAFSDKQQPASLVAKYGGVFTVVKFGGESDESIVVVSDKAGDYVSYMVPAANAETMALKLFVGDAFTKFERVYLDHTYGGERTLLYALV